MTIYDIPYVMIHEKISSEVIEMERQEQKEMLTLKICP